MLYVLSLSPALSSTIFTPRHPHPETRTFFLFLCTDRVLPLETPHFVKRFPLRDPCVSITVGVAPLYGHGFRPVNSDGSSCFDL